jgi:hypothetical protein
VDSAAVADPALLAAYGLALVAWVELT